MITIKFEISNVYWQVYLECTALYKHFTIDFPITYESLSLFKQNKLINFGSLMTYFPLFRVNIFTEKGRDYILFNAANPFSDFCLADLITSSDV